MIKQTVTISLQVCRISRKFLGGERFSESTAAKRFSADSPSTLVLILSRGIVIKIIKKLLLLVKIQPELRPTP